LHRFDTAHECDGQTDERTDGRPDDGKDVQSILLSRVKKELIENKKHLSNFKSFVTLISTLNRATA